MFGLNQFASSHKSSQLSYGGDQGTFSRTSNLNQGSGYGIGLCNKSVKMDNKSSNSPSKSVWFAKKQTSLLIYCSYQNYHSQHVIYLFYLKFVW